MSHNTTKDADPSYSPSGKKIAYSQAVREKTGRYSRSTPVGEARSDSLTTQRRTPLFLGEAGSGSCLGTSEECRSFGTEALSLRVLP